MNKRYLKIKYRIERSLINHNINDKFISYSRSDGIMFENVGIIQSKLLNNLFPVNVEKKNILDYFNWNDLFLNGEINPEIKKKYKSIISTIAANKNIEKTEYRRVYINLD